MKSDRDKEFEENMNHLVQLLKKILMSQPSNSSQLSELQSLFKGQGMNVNLCFFTFLPMFPEDFEELEEMCEQFLTDEDRRSEDMTTELSASDLEFLRKNGIRY